MTLNLVFALSSAETMMPIVILSVRQMEIAQETRNVALMDAEELV